MNLEGVSKYNLSLYDLEVYARSKEQCSIECRK